MALKNSAELLVAAALAALPPSAAAGTARLEVAADERVEFAAALHLEATRAGPLPGFIDDGGKYARALRALSSHAPDHPAVDAYRRSVLRPGAGEWGYMNALRELTLCLDRELRLRPGAECARSPLAGRAAAFAAATAFAAEWRKSARPLLDADVGALARARDQADLIAVFEEFTGSPAPARQEIVPSPLLAPGMFWDGLLRSEGTTGYDIIVVLSPVARPGKGPRFVWTPVMRDLWHEEGHALLDSWLDVEPSTGVLARAGLSGKSLEDCYGSWPQCVREHAAQGLAAAILGWARRGGRLPFYAEAAPKENLPLLPKVVERLRDYEGDRARYPTLRQFYPRLLEVLEAPASTATAPGPALAAGKDDSEKGVAAFAAGRREEAAAALARATQEDDRLASAWVSLAVVEASLGHGAPARRAADRAVELGRSRAELPPDFLSDALSTRAEIKHESGDAPGARADWTEALKTAPADWPRAEEVRRRIAEVQPTP